MTRLLVAASLLCLAACGSCRSNPAVATVEKAETKPDLVAAIQEETWAMAREEARPECGNRVSIYSGSIAVDATGYTHSVERGDGDLVIESIDLCDGDTLEISIGS